MALRAVALKEEGTHPAAEGILARFAQVRAIRSLDDVERVKEERPDIVLLDLGMQHLSGIDVLGVLRRSHRVPVFICFDSKIQPTTLLKQLTSLGNIRVTHRTRSPNLSQVVRLLGVSQEALGRMLNVSARTAHRWLKGTRPRRTQEVERLLEIVALLEQTLPSEDAIRSYLYRSNPILRGDKPIDLLIRGAFDRVAADLQAVQEGVYV
jgi:CheY-like chemotaxis protein